MIPLDPRLQGDLIAIETVTITIRTTAEDAVTGTALTVVGGMGQDGMTKEVGTDQPDHGDLSVITTEGAMSPTQQATRLRLNRRSRKVVARGWAMATMAVVGSKALVVPAEAVEVRIGIGSTRIS